MATWFAQNSSVNIDSANQWNSAANGSGSWLTWASLAAGDVLVANGKTSITINVNTTCATITTSATGGTAGGGFILAAGVTLTANITAGSSVCVLFSASSPATIVGNITGDTTAGNGGYGVNVTGTGTLSITGNVTGGGATNAAGIVHNSAGIMTITGNVTGGTGAGGDVGGNAVHSKSTGQITITGTVTGGSNSSSLGARAASGTINIVGDVYGGSGSAAYGASNVYLITGNIYATTASNAVLLPLRHVGNLYSASNGTLPLAGSGAYLIDASATVSHEYRINSGGSPGTARTLTTAGSNQAATTDVRSGVSYGGGTGSLVVPSPSYVASGVPTDNTVGSYTGGGLDAAGVRAAIGLASANLDTQLSTIDDFLDTEVAAIKIKTDQLAFTSGKVNAELDSATATQIDTIEAALTTLGSDSTTVERSVSDTNAITFSWPVSGATITGTASLNNGSYGAVAGAIAFLRTETGRHYYTLAYNVADRPAAEGQVRYKFVDGTYTGYVVLRTVNLVTAAQVNAQVLDVLSVDTFAELTAPPAATSSLKDKITWLFMYARNKVTQTAAQRKLYRDDGTTVAGTSGTTDDGTTFTKGEDA